MLIWKEKKTEIAAFEPHFVIPILLPKSMTSPAIGLPQWSPVLWPVHVEEPHRAAHVHRCQGLVSVHALAIASAFRDAKPRVKGQVTLKKL